MERRTLILTIVLVAQVALTAVLYRPADRGPGDEHRRLVEVEAGDITALVIRDGHGGEARLERTDQGWSVAPPQGAPGDGERIDRVLGQLAALTSQRLLTRSKGSRVRLRVSENKFDRRLEIHAGDKSLVYYLGTAQGGKGVNIRKDGDKEVYLATGLAVWDLQALPRQWWRDTLVDLPEEDMVAVTVRNRHGEFRLERREVKEAAGKTAASENGKEGQGAGTDEARPKDQGSEWVQSSGPTLSQGDMDAIISQARRISVDEYVAPDSARVEGDAALRLVIDRGDKEPLTLEFGPVQGEDKRLPVRAANLRAGAWVREASLLALLGAGAPVREAKDAADRDVRDGSGAKEEEQAGAARSAAEPSAEGAAR